MAIKINKNANLLIKLLQNAGYKAYVVGGCVRDSYLGIEPKDWDICTSATTEQMREVFKNYEIIPTGEKHGTLTIVTEGECFEVTTFRLDGKYTDSRRPDNVLFVSDIEQDLGRRDFTINAIAYNDEEGFIDPYHGLFDINKNIIKCVGKAEERFKEDPLRILRALRFAARFGFDIEKGTIIAMYNRVYLNGLVFVAKERIQKELIGIITAPYAYDILHDFYGIICDIIPFLDECVGFEQNNRYHEFDVYEHSLQALKNYPGNDKNVKIALFLHDIGKPDCYTTDERGGHFHGHPAVSKKKAEIILNMLRFSNDDKEELLTLIENHDIHIEPNKRHVKRALNKFGEPVLRKLFDMQKADILAHSPLGREERYNRVLVDEKILDEIIEENACFSLKDLAINGKDIINAGIPQGKEVGNALNYVLNAVMDGEKNEKEQLLKIVQEYILYKDAF